MADYQAIMMDHIHNLENEINEDRRLLVLNRESGDREGIQYYKGTANALFDVAEKLAYQLGMKIKEEMGTHIFTTGKIISYRKVSIGY